MVAGQFGDLAIPANGACPPVAIRPKPVLFVGKRNCKGDGENVLVGVKMRKPHCEHFATAVPLKRTLLGAVGMAEKCHKPHAPQQNDAHVLAYSITSSARPSSVSGKVRPSVLAVRLMISSTFVTCCTGSSAGFSPLRIRPV